MHRRFIFALFLALLIGTTVVSSSWLEGYRSFLENTFNSVTGKASHLQRGQRAPPLLGGSGADPPRLDAIIPSTLQKNTLPRTVTLQGSGFDPVFVIDVNGQLVQDMSGFSPYSSQPNTITLTLPATILPGEYFLAVVNSDMQKSSAIPLRILDTNQPVILQVTPIGLQPVKGQPPTDITVWGDFFDPAAQLFIDGVDVTALAEAATFAAPSGTPTNGQTLIITIKDNGTPRALTWNSAYSVCGATLPTTTVASKIHVLGFRHSTANSLNKWQLLAANVEA